MLTLKDSSFHKLQLNKVKSAISARKIFEVKAF